jgi:hypothetical protein
MTKESENEQPVTDLPALVAAQIALVSKLSTSILEHKMIEDVAKHFGTNEQHDRAKEDITRKEQEFKDATLTLERLLRGDTGG